MASTLPGRVAVFLLGIALGVGSAQARTTPRTHKRHPLPRHGTPKAALRPNAAPRHLLLQSASVLVQDQQSGQILVEKAPDVTLSIASITKLMTVMVVLDAQQNPNDVLSIVHADLDAIRHSRSRLPLGTCLTRSEALKLALMASENRAANALGHAYPGGMGACVAAMNAKARALGLGHTRYVDPAGLGEGNVSSARDLAQLLKTAYSYPAIRDYSTHPEEDLRSGTRNLHFVNTSRLVRGGRWEIGLSKTGFIDESGHCLVMQAKLASRSVFIVILKGQGKLTHFGDANRIRTWLEAKA